MSRVVVRAPATIANLGPGFDCLGIAIAWYNEVRVETDPSGELTITVAGEGADQISRDESNLVVRAIRDVHPSAGGLRIHLTSAIPFGRGFGSSAAAIVAGLIVGGALAGRHGPPSEVVARGARLEGHADNVAACVLGGAVVVAGERTQALGAAALEAVVCVSPAALSTEAARRALPDQVPFDLAVATAGRAALLAASLAREELGALMAATEDALHQPSRFALAPEAGALVEALRAEGVAAFLAGAGPSVAALTPAESGAKAEAAAHRSAPDGWDVRRVQIDPRGAEIVEQDSSRA